MTKTRSFLYLSVVIALTISAGACQTMSDLDPTGLLSDDDSAATSQFPADSPAPASDANQGTTPDLASLPDRPVAATPAEQQQTAQGIAADGAQARYSADVLRGGTEAAAPAPGIASAAPLPQMMASNAPPTTDAPPSTDEAPTTDAPPAAAPPPPSPNTAVPGARQPVQTASAPPPPSAEPSSPVPGAQPAVPANTPVRGVSSGGVMSDASLGFQRSSAPPLDPGVNNWVPSPIVARYRQTASNAGISAASGAAAVPGRAGPDMSSGAVVANLGAISSGPAAIAAMNGGVAPTAVVYFLGDGTSLSAAARSEVRGAVQAFKSNGGAGTIRVIGHASSRTSNMSVEKHLELIFNKSQARANAVAQALIRAGVPADKVLVEAVGDSQPVFYESMPKGEDGNRRAEIYVQS